MCETGKGFVDSSGDVEAIRRHMYHSMKQKIGVTVEVKKVMMCVRCNLGSHSC